LRTTDLLNLDLHSCPISAVLPFSDPAPDELRAASVLESHEVKPSEVAAD